MLTLIEKLFLAVMDKLQCTQHFSYESNVSHTCKIWHKHFCFYLTVADNDNKDDKTKTSTLLTCIDQIVK